MAEINRRTGRPVTFGVAQSNAGPELYKVILDLVDEEAATRRRAAAADDGARHRSAVRHAAPHVLRPRAVVAGAPGPRPRRSGWPCSTTTQRRAELVRDAEAQTFRPSTGTACTCSPTTASTTAAIPPTRSRRTRERAGETIPEAFVRISRETRGRALFNFPFLNQRMDAVEAMLEHPRMLVGLGDSGAHVGLIMDASLPTWFLAHWIRDREKFSIEEGIRRLTSDTADLFGIADRGRLVPGAYADVNVIDLDQLGAPAARIRARLPGRCRPVRAALDAATGARS